MATGNCWQRLRNVRPCRPPLAVYKNVYSSYDGSEPSCLCNYYELHKDRPFVEVMRDLYRSIITGDETSLLCVVGLSPCLLRHWRGYLPDSPILLAVEEAPDPAHMVSILLDHRADPDVVNRESDTALILAAHYRQRDVVQTLVNHPCGCRFLDAQDASGMTALHQAVLHGDAKMCRTLLKRRASRVIVDNMGRTALDWARLRKDEEVVQALEQQQNTKD